MVIWQGESPEFKTSLAWLPFWRISAKPSARRILMSSFPEITRSSGMDQFREIHIHHDRRKTAPIVAATGEYVDAHFDRFADITEK